MGQGGCIQEKFVMTNNNVVNCRRVLAAIGKKLLLMGMLGMFLLASGCITVSKEAYRDGMLWEPVPASRLIEASVRIVSECKFTADYHQYWKSFLNTDESIVNYQRATCDAIEDDMSGSRIFRKIVTPGDPNYDLLIKVVSINSKVSEKISLSVVDPKRQDVIASYDGFVALSTNNLAAMASAWNAAVKRILADIRNQMTSDYLEGKGVKSFLIANGKIQEPSVQSQQKVVIKSDIDETPILKSDINELPTIKIKQNKNAYAIVIGIENYRQKLPKADFAMQDARLVADYLTKSMGYPEENVVILLNDRAAKSDFEKYFEKWLGNNVEKDSAVFIYYSGHGAPNTKTGDAYLVPYDGDPSFIDQTGYSLKRMYDALGKLPAKEIIVALDSCFSGAGGRSVLAKGARPLVMNLQSNTVLSKNITVMSASSGEQISSTYDEKGHGLFTYFLLKGIKNEDVIKQDGSINMDDLYNYIKPQVERIARKQFNNEQTPQLMGAKK